MEWSGPILDNHLHLDLDGGVGRRVVDEFVNVGGTHLMIVNKPSWWYGVSVDKPEDFTIGFDSTCETVATATETLPGRAWSILGVHPALISRLIDNGMEISDAEELMKGGIDIAADRVAKGEAIAIKSGRPHYPVDDDVWDASNEVIMFAFERAAEVNCPVQLHTESGEDFSELADWATAAGLDPSDVVKHYADGPTEGVTASVISRREPLERVVASGEPFLMETDYLDDPDRPGAVLGTKTVPRRVSWLDETDRINAIKCAHVETPRRVYDIDLWDTLDD